MHAARAVQRSLSLGPGLPGTTLFVALGQPRCLVRHPPGCDRLLPTSKHAFAPHALNAHTQPKPVACTCHEEERKYVSEPPLAGP